MKQWDHKIDACSKFGICTVREHTDKEVNTARENGLLFAHCDGYVNLFHGEKFVGWCGSAWAENRIIKNEDPALARGGMEAREYLTQQKLDSALVEAMDTLRQNLAIYTTMNSSKLVDEIIEAADKIAIDLDSKIIQQILNVATDVRGIYQDNSYRIMSDEQNGIILVVNKIDASITDAVDLTWKLTEKLVELEIDSKGLLFEYQGHRS